MDTTLINQSHRALALMLYHETLRTNPVVSDYGVPVWNAVISDVEIDGEVAMSIVPLAVENTSSLRIASLLLIASTNGEHTVALVPMPEEIDSVMAIDSFDLREFLIEYEFVLFCHSPGLRPRDPGCYNFHSGGGGLWNCLKKFFRDIMEEEGSGYGGPFSPGTVIIIVYGGHGNNNWMYGGGYGPGNNGNMGGGGSPAGGNNGNGGGSVGAWGFGETLIDVWSNYYDCLSNSPALSQTVMAKQFQYMGALHIINYVLQEVLSFLCHELTEPYHTAEYFNVLYSDQINQHYSFIEAYEKLGYDHTQNDILLCLMNNPGVVSEILELLEPDVLSNVCEPAKTAEDILHDAVMAACANGEIDDMEELFNELKANNEGIIIRENVKMLCPQYDCILKNMISGPLGTQFVCDFFSKFEYTDGKILVVRASDFNALGYDPNAYAATDFYSGQITIQINSLMCNTVDPIAVFETIQHELVHAEIRRQLRVNYNLDPLGWSYSACFFEFVYENYDSGADFTEHEIMLRYFLNPMIESLIEMNNGVGTEQDFKGLVLNGFPLDVLFACGYSPGEVTSLYYTYLDFIDRPGNINSMILNCE